MYETEFMCISCVDTFYIHTNKHEHVIQNIILKLKLGVIYINHYVYVHIYIERDH